MAMYVFLYCLSRIDYIFYFSGVATAETAEERCSPASPSHAREDSAQCVLKNWLKSQSSSVRPAILTEDQEKGIHLLM